MSLLAHRHLLRALCWLARCSSQMSGAAARSKAALVLTQAEPLCCIWRSDVAHSSPARRHQEGAVEARGGLGGRGEKGVEE